MGIFDDCSIEEEVWPPPSVRDRGVKLYIGETVGTLRFLHEEKIRLTRSPVTLLVVAGDTCTDQVFPSIPTPLRARDDMVGRQGDIFCPTILAPETISAQYVLPGQGNLPFRRLDINAQPHDTRKGETEREGPNLDRFLLYDLSLSKEHHDNGPFCTADAERLIVLVQHQDQLIQHR